MILLTIVITIVTLEIIKTIVIMILIILTVIVTLTVIMQSNHKIKSLIEKRITILILILVGREDKEGGGGDIFSLHLPMLCFPSIIPINLTFSLLITTTASTTIQHRLLKCWPPALPSGLLLSILLNFLSRHRSLCCLDLSNPRCCPCNIVCCFWSSLTSILP